MATQQKQTQQRPAVQQQRSAPSAQTAAIEKHKPQELAEVPEYLKRAPGQGAAGFEEVEQGDLTLPRLGLCQALSPQRDETDPKYIEGLNEGEYFNTLTGESYGGTIQIVPLLFFKNKIAFRDKNAGGGMLCRSDDMKHGSVERADYGKDGVYGGDCLTCPFNRFGSAKGGKGKGKACTDFYNFPSLVVIDSAVKPEGLAVVSLKSSGVPVAKDWLAKMRLRQIDMFGGIYELSSKKKKFTEGSAFVTLVEPAGNVTRETYVSAQQAHNAMSDLRRQNRLRVDTTDIESEIEDPDAPGDAAE
jgi:hypothetical protein